MFMSNRSPEGDAVVSEDTKFSLGLVKWIVGGIVGLLITIGPIIWFTAAWASSVQAKLDSIQMMQSSATTTSQQLKSELDAVSKRVTDLEHSLDLHRIQDRKAP
jgi:hypothetical protein